MSGFDWDGINNFMNDGVHRAMAEGLVEKARDAGVPVADVKLETPDNPPVGELGHIDAERVRALALEIEASSN